MPITEAQAKFNQQALEMSNADPIKCRLTGKQLAFDVEKDEWIASDQPLSPRLLKIRWGWMGKNYGPDEKGFMRELKGRVDGKMTFGGNIPRAAFIHHNQTMKNATKTNTESNVTVYEVVEVGEDAPKTVAQMNVGELIAFGVSQGLVEADLEKMKKPELVTLLSPK